MRILPLIVVLGTSLALHFTIPAESKTGARKLSLHSEHKLEGFLLRYLKNEARANDDGKMLEKILEMKESEPGVTQSPPSPPPTKAPPSQPPTQPPPTQPPPVASSQNLRKEFYSILEKEAAVSDEGNILEKILEMKESQPSVTALPPPPPPPDTLREEFVQEFIKEFEKEFLRILDKELESLIRQLLKDESGENDKRKILEKSLEIMESRLSPTQLPPSPPPTQPPPTQPPTQPPPTQPPPEAETLRKELLRILEKEAAKNHEGKILKKIFAKSKCIPYPYCLTPYGE